MTVSIIGTRGTGKSTFLGLLHQIMEVYTVSNPKNFGYFMNPKTTDKVITGIRDPLRSGLFPTPTLKGDFQKLSFLMGFKPKILDRMKFLGKQGSLKGLYRSYNKGMIFTMHDVPGEDIGEFRKTQRLTKKLKEILDAKILVLLIDGEKFTRKQGTNKFDEMNVYDGDLAVIISAYCKHVKTKGFDLKKIHPVFIMAKLDAADKEILDMFGGKEKFISSSLKYNEKQTREIGKTLMSTYLTATRAQIIGSKQLGIPLEKNAKYFFSGVELDEKGKIKGGLEKYVDYTNKEMEFYMNENPREHYKEFIKYCEKLSELYEDPEERAVKYLKEADNFGFS